MHIGIAGNEEVGGEAKTAVEGQTSEDAKLPKALRKSLKISRSAVRQQLYESIKERWNGEWKVSPRYDKLEHEDPSRKYG